MPVALITGIGGQDGSYLAERLVAEGYVVHGTVRRGRGGSARAIPGTLAPVIDRITVHPVEIGDRDTVQALVGDIRPDECFDLAGHSLVRTTQSAERVMFHNMVENTHALLEALHRTVPACRVFVAASSEIFGAARETPQNETSPLNPRSIYGVAKATCYHLARHYRQAHGLFVAVGVLYNHESPRRSPDFVVRKITRGVARIHLGLERTLPLGNLDALRDWGYAPEYVASMRRMLAADDPDDYVLATGTLHPVRDVVEIAFGQVGRDHKDHVTRDEQLFVPSEAVPLCGDPAKAARLLDWRATKPLVEIVREMVEADLAALRSSGAADGAPIGAKAGAAARTAR